MIEAHALAAGSVNGHAILALVILEPDMGFPFALEVTLLGPDAFGASEKGVSAQVLVTLLDKTKSGLVPHKPVNHQLRQRCVDVALALEQLVPLRFLADHTDRAADPVVDPERIIALQEPRIAPLMPAEQSRTGAARAVGAVLKHGERFIRGQLPAPERHHADTGRNVVIEHDDGLLREALDDPVAHGAHAGHGIRDRDLFRQRDVAVSLNLAFRKDQRCRREQAVARDRPWPAPAHDDQAKAQGIQFGPARFRLVERFFHKRVLRAGSAARP